MGIQAFHLLVALCKDGTPTPTVCGVMISGEDHGSITTDFKRLQWATVMTISAETYEEAKDLILHEIRNNPNDAWLRPWFDKSDEAKELLRSYGIGTEEDGGGSVSLRLRRTESFVWTVALEKHCELPMDDATDDDCEGCPYADRIWMDDCRIPWGVEHCAIRKAVGWPVSKED